MYDTTDSVPRSDISTCLMEAVGQEKLFIAQELMPIYDSEREIGRYPRFRKQAAELLRSGRDATSSTVFNSTTKRNSTGTYREVDRQFEWDSYQTEERGLTARVDDKVARQMQSFFDAEMVEAKLLMNELMIDYEMEVAAKLNTTSITDTAEGLIQTAPAVDYTEANIASIDFPRDMNACIERLTLLGTPPEQLTMVLSLAVYNRLRRTQKLQTYLYGSLNTTQGGSNITEQMIAQAFGLKGVFIAKKSVDYAVKGLAPNLAAIWGNTNVLVGQLGAGDFMAGGLGRTITWSADSPGGLWTSESFRDEPRRSVILRVRSNRVLKMIDPTAGQLIQTNFS